MCPAPGSGRMVSQGEGLKLVPSQVATFLSSRAATHVDALDTMEVPGLASLALKPQARKPTDTLLSQELRHSVRPHHHTSHCSHPIPFPSLSWSCWWLPWACLLSVPLNSILPVPSLPPSQSPKLTENSRKAAAASWELS